MDVRGTNIVWWLCAWLVAVAPLRGQTDGEVRVRLHPEVTENHIDEKIYGFLLEHIYHSVSNGIWGETVWNLSFEQLRAEGPWHVDSHGEVLLDALEEGTDVSLFRFFRGKDCELSLRLRREQGDGPVLVGLRDQNRERMMTNRLFWWLGVEGNTRFRLDSTTGWVWHTPRFTHRVEAETFGSLPYGQWVSVRLRAEGAHLTGWVDGNKVLDCCIADCPLEGSITLGGKGCRVRMRDIEVRSLDSTSIPLDLSPTRHWRIAGEGSVRVSREDALNHDVALRLDCKGKWVALEQADCFSSREGDPLVGSVYLRGSVDSVLVQLIKEEHVLSEQRIASIGEQWQEFPLELAAGRDVPRCTLRITTSGQGELFVDQVSLMHRSSATCGGWRTDLLDAVDAVAPAVLRWPGGVSWRNTILRTA